MTAVLTNQRGYMRIPNPEVYIDDLMTGIGVIIVILLLLELLTIERPRKPVEEQKKWKESEEDDCILVDKPPE